MDEAMNQDDDLTHHRLLQAVQERARLKQLKVPMPVGSSPYKEELGAKTSMLGARAYNDHQKLMSKQMSKPYNNSGDKEQKLSERLSLRRE